MKMADSKKEEESEGFRWFWQKKEDEKKEKRDGQRQVVENEQKTIVASMKDLPSWVRKILDY